MMLRTLHRVIGMPTSGRRHPLSASCANTKAAQFASLIYFAAVPLSAAIAPSQPLSPDAPVFESESFRLFRALIARSRRV